MTRNGVADEKVRMAHSVFIRLVLAPFTIHFKSPTYLREGTLELLDKRVCKETLQSTANNVAVRESIGMDIKFWSELVLCLRAAIPSLERRSFTIWDPSAVDYESTSGALIASNYPGLWKDLERLNDLVSISRNVLTIGSVAQDLATAHQVDTEIFRLVNACVRVTARGYDGEAGTGDEEKWQWIVNAYKKLLITCLQFVNNLVAQNERRKMMLWMALFDHTLNDSADVMAFNPEDVPETSRTTLADMPSNPAVPPQSLITSYDLLVAYGTDGEDTIRHSELDAVKTNEPKIKYMPPPRFIQLGAEAAYGGDKSKLVGNSYVWFCKERHNRAIDYYSREPTRGEEYLLHARQWHQSVSSVEDTEDHWQALYEDAVAKYRAECAVWEAKMSMHRRSYGGGHQRHEEDEGFADGDEEEGAKLERRVEELEAEIAKELRLQGPEILTTQNLQYRPTLVDDFKCLFTAEAGARILESGKIELMKRLSDYSPDASLRDLQDLYSKAPENSNPDGSVLNSVRRHDLIKAEPHINQPSQIDYYGALPMPSQLDIPSNDAETEAASMDGELKQAEPDMIEDSAPEDEEEEDEEDEEDEEEDEDYPGSNEDGRGLLTDVPLILGPSEIEVLPMLIMSAIVPPTPRPGMSESERLELSNLAYVRTQILLSQSSGRNLLRELLIFVAAWDLREEELYFKFMIKILEAILKSGLMPYAYHAFRDRSRSKDIISPAQAVIMKLLTCIYRGRNLEAKQALSAGPQPKTVKNVEKQARQETARKILATAPLPDPPGVKRAVSDPHHPTECQRRHLLLMGYAPPSRTDLHTLNFLFTEFRQHIIPQTCALIFLQGQIHAGRAQPEDFPLNLWDMERMYEGVYQFLEFFAVVCEDSNPASGVPSAGQVATNTPPNALGSGGWGKGVLAEWEATSELVALLRELEGGSEKRSVGGGLRYAKGAAIGTVPSAVRRVSQQAGVATVPPVTHPVPPPQQRSLSADAVIPSTQTLATHTQKDKPAPPAVEKPFDVEGANEHGHLVLPPLSLPPELEDPQSIFEAETPLAYPEDPIGGVPHSAAGAHAPAPPPLHPTAADQDEPSDFEWRNLKKLTVLVLSSLVWKNKKVQDQLRAHGGLEALVSCCRPDENNPYIREHAIMCLRFAVEANAENAEAIRKMAREQPNHAVSGAQRQIAANGSQSVAREVLSDGGYETFTDGKGQVGLRRKDGSVVHTAGSSAAAVVHAAQNAIDMTGPSPPVAAAGASAAAAVQAAVEKAGLVPPGSSASTNASKPPPPRLSPAKLTAEKAAELMQNALRDLPLGDKLVTDKQKAEALAKLDKAFESTERVLGKKHGGNSAGP
ncbi:hypothetical protein BAUCODRAFT_29852 [Baudoinia panamericana UAMH 10762]|uniref:Ataxin-10 homolog n=1 Tax=Baudoinia panamericana (strain UAMH 10762) TaxID=717646 RepID=M2LXV5_BAUPA|nr:uncharacterized protein BAUCODRAFT_29852 [Baudoinia panamericana UAMH 10762]EMC99507.1 hypothetical protein BAUCODRAFT_29852 [Baudoinia panamericana UAMH 10762]